jgi:hypothetical protein
VTTPRWATTLVRGPLGSPSAPPPPRIAGDAVALPLHVRSRYRAAAHHARRLFPGALGELVARELRANADFGVRPADDGLSARLAAQVLAMSVPAPRAREEGARRPGQSSST